MLVITKHPLRTGTSLRYREEEEYKAAHRAADRLVRPMEDSFLEAISRARGQIDWAQVRAGFRARHREAVIQALPDDVFHRLIEANFRRQMHQALNLAGNMLYEEIVQMMGRGGSRKVIGSVIEKAQRDVQYNFDEANPRAANAAARAAADLVTNIDAETRSAIRQIVTDAFDEQYDIDEETRHIREVLLENGFGLDRVRARQLDRYAGGLFEKGLDLATIRDRVEKQGRYLVTKRARVIARTETMTASNLGIQESFLQARDSGLIPETSEREWVATPDDRVHPGCAEMEGQRVGLDEPFDYEDGPLMEPPGHPLCRCTIILIITADRERAWAEEQAIVVPEEQVPIELPEEEEPVEE